MYKVLSIRYLQNIRLLFLFILATLYLLLNTAPAGAQTMSNKDYILKTQGLNAVSGVTSNTDYQLRSTVGELSPEVWEGVNFKVSAGFENAASTLPFSASLSSDLTDFGPLSPTNPIIRTVDLSVYSLSAYGYSVIASENHPLQSDPDASGAIIPNTTCDNGECNHENAGVWTNPLSFGFGYRCDNLVGIDCDRSFSKPNFYKHFADASNSTPLQPVMAGIGSKNKDVRLSYKVNISGNQIPVTYTNIVTYIAVPNF